MTIVRMDEVAEQPHNYGAPDPDASWKTRGACLGMGRKADRVFFPTSGESAREAKIICQGCDVVSECLEHAINKPEHHGVWGGLNERERRKLSINQKRRAG